MAKYKKNGVKDKIRGHVYTKRAKIRGHVYTEMVKKVTHLAGTSVLTPTMKDTPPPPEEVRDIS